MVAFLPQDSLARKHRVFEALRRAGVPGETGDLRKVAEMICHSLDLADPEAGDPIFESLHVAACLYGLGRIDQAWQTLDGANMPSDWFLAGAALVEQSVVCPQVWRLVTCGLLRSREDPGGASNAWRLCVSPLCEASHDLYELGALAWSKRLARWLLPLADAGEGDLRIALAGLRDAAREPWTRSLRQALAWERERQGWRLTPHVFAD